MRYLVPVVYLLSSIYNYTPMMEPEKHVVYWTQAMYAEMPVKYYAAEAIHWGGYGILNRPIMAVGFALNPLRRKRTCLVLGYQA